MTANDKTDRCPLLRNAFICVALAVAVAGGAGGVGKDEEAPDVIDIDPARLTPGYWLQESIVPARPVFEEDTSLAPLWDTGTCYLRVESDSVPTCIYVDGRKLTQNGSPMLISLPPGRHYVGYFPADRVQLTFRDEAPRLYWQWVGRDAQLAGDYDLMSTFDRSAVRSGTRWTRPAHGDTVNVRLSWRDTRRAYLTSGHHTAWAVFGITTAIAVAMVISQALVEN